MIKILMDNTLVFFINLIYLKYMFYYSILFNLSVSLLPFFTLNLNVLKLQAVILPNRWIVGLTFEGLCTFAEIYFTF